MNSYPYALTTYSMHSTHATLEEAQSFVFPDEPCAISYNDDVIFESHPDECVFCWNMKPFCICEPQES